METKILILFVMVLFFVGGVSAADILVATPVTAATINSAIASAQPGDCVIIPDGVYNSLGQIKVPSDVDGTEANPITLKSATVGGVTFTGNPAGARAMFIQGDWWVIKDFKFIDISEIGNANTYGIITRDATGTRVTNNYFEGFGVLTDLGKYSWCIWIGSGGTGNYSRVDHNTFVENDAIHIAIYSTAKYCQIDHNYLKDSLNIPGGNGGLPTLHLGSDSGTQIDLYTIVEYNLFENTLGASEALANKGSSNTYQYNVFKSTAGKKGYGPVLRGGDDCIIDGNYFFDVDKQNIRVHGTGHKIINNYFENPGYSAILLAEGNAAYQDVSDIFIASNTIVNPKVRAIYIGWWGTGGTEPENLTFKNNIITSNVAGSYLVKDSGHTGTFIWENNLHYATDGASYWQNDGGGNEPGSGITHADPNLTQGTYIKRLQASSANAIEDGTPDGNVTDDIDGHTRDGTNPDIGCDEYSVDIPVRLPVQESDVGVSWLMATPTCQSLGHRCCDFCESGPQPLYDADCTGQVCCEVCSASTNQVLHFTFEEGLGTTATDSSGNNNHGTINGATYTTGKIGNYALQFDGVDDYVDCGNDNSLNVNYLTSSLWLKADSFSDNAGLFAKGDNLNRQYWAWIYQNNLSLEIDEGGHYNNLYPFQINNWYHLVVTYDGSNVITYVNGIEVNGIAQNTGLILTDDDSLLIGKLPGFNSFNGKIDEVRIYNYALSSQEVLALYNAGQSICSPADTNTDNEVDIIEIINYMASWKAGTVSIENLMIGIGEWKNGC